MYVSASRKGIGVALKAPKIARRHLFCIIHNLLLEVSDFLMSIGVCPMVEPQVIAKECTCLDLENVAPLCADIGGPGHRMLA